ncbi:hypothetical protein Tco_0066999, partial [Tanacetum coccineum]
VTCTLCLKVAPQCYYSAAVRFWGCDKNKQTDNTFAKVVSNKENVIDVAVANASKAKTLLCVSCMQSVLIPCHDKCVAKHKFNVCSNARRMFSVNSRIPKSFETTFVAPTTRFSKKATQSKTLDTTFVASKSKIDEASASKARDNVSSAFKKKKRNMRNKPLSPFMLNKIQTSSPDRSMGCCRIPYNTSLHIIQHESKKKREEEMKVLERGTRERVEREYRKGNEKDILK